MAVTKPKDWTPEQVENAMKYMVCRVCGTPRELRVEKDKDGEITRMGIVCPNGHPQ